jgi:hypothetical protein
MEKTDQEVMRELSMEPPSALKIMRYLMDGGKPRDVVESQLVKRMLEDVGKFATEVLAAEKDWRAHVAKVNGQMAQGPVVREGKTEGAAVEAPEESELGMTLEELRGEAFERRQFLRLKKKYEVGDAESGGGASQGAAGAGRESVVAVAGGMGVAAE